MFVKCRRELQPENEANTDSSVTGMSLTSLLAALYPIGPKEKFSHELCPNLSQHVLFLMQASVLFKFCNKKSRKIYIMVESTVSHYL